MNILNAFITLLLLLQPHFTLFLHSTNLNYPLQLLQLQRLLEVQLHAQRLNVLHKLFR
jgi:hypothetical protein